MGRTNWTNQRCPKQHRWCVNPCWTGSSKSSWCIRAAGVQRRGAVCTAGMQNSSSQIPAGLLCLTLLYKDTRRGNDTIVSYYQRTKFRGYFQHSENSEQRKQRCGRVLINLSCSGRIMTPRSVGEYQFHTSESSSHRKCSQWCDKRLEMLLKTKKQLALFLPSV